MIVTCLQMPTNLIKLHIFYVIIDISSLSRFSESVSKTFPKYLRKAFLTSSGSSSRLEWISGSLLKFGAASKRMNFSLQIINIVNTTPLWLARGLPKGRCPSTAQPGLWWAISRHWLSCKPWEEMNIECQVSISLRWLGTSGLKMTTTPQESFMRAGQHDSYL